MFELGFLYLNASLCVLTVLLVLHSYSFCLHSLFHNYTQNYDKHRCCLITYGRIHLTKSDDEVKRKTTVQLSCLLSATVRAIYDWPRARVPIS